MGISSDIIGTEGLSPEERTARVVTLLAMACIRLAEEAKQSPEKQEFNPKNEDGPQNDPAQI